ncbi:MAG TPA: plasma-membrane proton-efflux P-type ATPase [Alphaproteobacteria bacterium]|nr:plasma-membrane proton-efflux P-type ATPase [Alphaproteobacteria bacterium]
MRDSKKLQTDIKKKAGIKKSAAEKKLPVDIKTDVSTGLTDKEAALRLQKYGDNALPEKHQSLLLKLLSYFWGPIPGMIEAAAVLSGIMKHWWDLIIIAALLFINAAVGFWQEYKADNAIELLKAKLALTARVLRDGKWREIPAHELVPGDVVFLNLGNIVPADMSLVSGDSLSVDQSQLTGESLPVDKKIGETAYSGSTVRLGQMQGIVTATGAKSYFGKTAKLVEAAGTVSHFQHAVLKIGDFLICVTIALVAIILLAAFLRHTPFLETLQFCLVLTVAAIPVALPAVLSVTMAVGAEKLAKMKAIVSRLVAIEELAGIDVLCADKTGTLTQNKLTVGDVWCTPGVDHNELLWEGSLSSSKESSDIIDHTIIKAAGELPKGYKIIHLEPFNSVIKHTMAKISKGGKTLFIAKGAPQVIAKMCGSGNEVDSKVEAFATQGYRTIAVARKDGNKWKFRGLIPLFDPPRKDAAQTLDEAKSMGVSIKMITGDHVSIARQISAKLHLGLNILVASNLFGKSLSKKALYDALDQADGIAEVFPANKYDIVKDLQGQGHIVGMTGDGVNDAPALKQADVGIAVSGATDAARAAADIVLTTTGISVIVSGIAEARRIFHRMLSYATFRIAETMRVLLFMTLSILIFDFYPVTVIMIVLLAILNDFPIMMIAFDNASVAKKPVRWDMLRVLSIATALGIVGVISTFSVFWFVEYVMHLPRPTIQTLMFLKLLVAGHLTIYITRDYSWFWARPWPALKFIGIVELTQVFGTLAAVYGWFMEPIGWIYALAIWGYALLWFVINDLMKVELVRLLDLRLAWKKKPISHKQKGK